MPSTDLALGLALHGYLFSGAVHRGAGAREDPDALRLRLLGRHALLVRGCEGVRFFTDTAVIQRESAIPTPLAHTLFGRGAVHGLDDRPHLHRKRLFVRATKEAAVETLVETVRRAWVDETRSWSARPVNVYDRAVAVIGPSVISWAGIDVPPARARAIARHLALIVDGFGVPGAPFARAAASRRRVERWAEDVVSAVRTQAPAPSAARGTALEVVSQWTDDHGVLLPAHTAAVELLNLLRPTVAVSRFVSFATLALAQHPSWRRSLADELSQQADGRPGRTATAFAQEVRRLTPFVPALVGIARRETSFRGHAVPVGTRVVLDVLGTNTDPRWWPDPMAFDPGRFLGGQVLEPDALVPQGGGLVSEGHRCPGEDTTLGIIATTSAHLAGLPWHLPAQDLRVNWRRMPTRPGRGLLLALDAA